MNNIFSYVKKNIDIVDVIGDYVNLTKAGNYYKGFSPFKHEKTPSFTVTPEKNIFYCFSSHIGGDVIEFIAKIENCSQYQAVQFLIQKYNLTIPKTLNNNHKQQNQGTDDVAYFKVYTCFIEWCHSLLYANRAALDYLYKRGITDETIKKFKLGYCPDSAMTESFCRFAATKNILITDIKLTDILIIKNKKIYFSAYNRIIFPIQNYLQLYCGYGARIFLPQDTRPKYINTNNNNHFIKKNLLYGFSQAKETIKADECVFIVEGYMDAIMMHQSGYSNTIATMGTACTKNHIHHISKFTNYIKLVYDGDVAGKDAMKKIIEICWNMSIDIDVILLPPGTDPAELAQHNTLTQSLQNLQHASSFLISQIPNIQANESLFSLHQSLSEIINIIEMINDEIKKSAVILQIAKELSLNPHIIFNLIEKSKSTKKESLAAAASSDLTIQNEKQNHIITPDTDISADKKKIIWYVFFYFILMNWNACKIKLAKFIFIYKNFGIPILGDILTQYKNQENEFADCLDFLKNNYDQIYTHSIKIYATYKFEFEQLPILYNKILALAWQEYKKDNPERHFRDLIESIENHTIPDDNEND
jgi:DNA primase